MQHAPPVRSLFPPLRSPHDEGPGVDDAADQSVHGSGSPSLPILEMPRTYQCPGEKHAIPRSIHLARLAAFYPNCRHCEHRTETGQMPRSLVGRLDQSARRIEPQSPFRREGVRGEYVNQLTRQTASGIAAAVAERLWAEKNWVGRTASPDEDGPPQPGKQTRPPAVVLGLDSRHSSPDLCVGVSESLRRMGCDVVDVGRVTGPCLAFAVDHLHATAGIHVTGSGGPDSWTGLDVVGVGGVPWSPGGTLAEVERRYRTGVSRPTRRGGSQRFFDALLPYRASLLKHYQELRPLRIVCGAADPTLFDVLVPLFDALPCELIPHTSPRLKAKVEADRDLQVAALRAAVRDSSADYGVLLGEDGAALRLFAGDRRPFPAADVLRFVLLHSGLPRAAPAVVGAGVDDACRAVLTDLGYAALHVSEGAEPVARAMQEHAALVGVQAGGRIWFRDSHPRCDAAVTLGLLLRALSLRA